jgi:hypothetical protein
VGYSKGHRAELLLHLASKNEGPLVEQDVTTLTIDLWKEHCLDQPVTIIEGHKLHRLVGLGVHRLGRREHSSGQNVAANMLMHFSAGTKTEGPKLVGMELHGVRVADKSQSLVFLPAAAFGGVFLERRDGGW